MNKPLKNFGERVSKYSTYPRNSRSNSIFFSYSYSKWISQKFHLYESERDLVIVYRPKLYNIDLPLRIRTLRPTTGRKIRMKNEPFLFFQTHFDNAETVMMLPTFFSLPSLVFRPFQTEEEVRCQSFVLEKPEVRVGELKSGTWSWNYMHHPNHPFLFRLWTSECSER